MKKFLPIALTLSTAMAIQAQITITSTDFASVNDTILMGVDDQPVTNLNVGTPGTNKTWDFTALQTISIKDIVFADPATLPNGASFPSSNIAQIEEGNVIYLDKSSSGVTAVGTEQSFNGMAFAAQFNPAYTILPFPLNYGDSFGGTYNFDKSFFLGIDTTVNYGITIQVQIDSIRLKRQATITADVDAWGTVTTPLAAVPALRASVNQVNVDTTWAYFGQPVNVALLGINFSQGWNLIDQSFANTISLLDPSLGALLGNATATTTTDTKEFFANNYKYRFAQIEVDVANNNSPVRAEFLSNYSIMNSIETFESMPDLKVFPNPTSDFVSFSKSVPAGTLYRIYDTNGSLVDSKLVQSNTIALQSLSSGNYTIILYNKDNTVLAAERIIVVK